MPCFAPPFARSFAWPSSPGNPLPGSRGSEVLPDAKAVPGAQERFCTYKTVKDLFAAAGHLPLCCFPGMHAVQRAGLLLLIPSLITDRLAAYASHAYTNLRSKTGDGAIDTLPQRCLLASAPCIPSCRHRISAQRLVCRNLSKQGLLLPDASFHWLA